LKRVTETTGPNTSRWTISSVCRAPAIAAGGDLDVLLLLRPIDESGDPCALLGADERTHFDTRGRLQPGLYRAHRRREVRDELVVDQERRLHGRLR